MEISTKKISYMRFSFETHSRLSFLPPFTGGKKCLEFPLRNHKIFTTKGNILQNASAAG